MTHLHFLRTLVFYRVEIRRHGQLTLLQVEKTAQKYWSRVSRTFPNETYLSRIRLQFTEVNIISPNEFESIVPDQNGSLGYLDLIPTPPSLELHCCLRSPNRNERKVAFGVDNRQLLGQDVRILIADSQALQFTLQAGHAFMTLGPGQQTFQDSALDMIQRQDLCLRLKGESDEVVRQLVNAVRFPSPSSCGVTLIHRLV